MLKTRVKQTLKYSSNIARIIALRDNPEIIIGGQMILGDTQM